MLTDIEKACPFCHTDLRVGNTFSRLIGIEIQGKYDGVLAWRCPDCAATWDRWPEKPSGIATHELTQKVVAPRRAMR